MRAWDGRRRKNGGGPAHHRESNSCGEDETERKMFTTENTEITENKHKKINWMGRGDEWENGLRLEFQNRQWKSGDFLNSVPFSAI